jgi:hypothetical protein
VNRPVPPPSGLSAARTGTAEGHSVPGSGTDALPVSNLPAGPPTLTPPVCPKTGQWHGVHGWSHSRLRISEAVVVDWTCYSCGTKWRIVGGAR